LFQIECVTLYIPFIPLCGYSQARGISIFSVRHLFSVKVFKGTYSCIICLFIRSSCWM